MLQISKIFRKMNLSNSSTNKNNARVVLPNNPVIIDS